MHELGHHRAIALRHRRPQLGARDVAAVLLVERERVGAGRGHPRVWPVDREPVSDPLCVGALNPTPRAYEPPEAIEGFPVNHENSSLPKLTNDLDRYRSWISFVGVSTRLDHALVTVASRAGQRQSLAGPVRLLRGLGGLLGVLPLRAFVDRVETEHQVLAMLRSRLACRRDARSGLLRSLAVRSAGARLAPLAVVYRTTSSPRGPERGA